MRLVLLPAVALVAAAAPAALAQTPDVTVDPDDFSAELVVGESTSRALLIGNDGDGALAFRVRTVAAASRPVVYAVSAYDGRLYAVDPETGAVRSEAALPVGGLPAFDGGALYLLSGSVLYTLDPQTGIATESVTLQTPGDGSSSFVDVAAVDGEVAVAVYSDRGVRVDVFDPATGTRTRTLALALSEVHTVAAGDGVLYVTGRDAQAGNVLVTLDAATGARLRTAAFPRTRSLTYSRGLGALLALSEDSERTVRLYSAETGAFLSAFDLPAPQGGYAYYGGVAADEGAEAGWLAVSPRTGTVARGGQVGATVTFETRGLVAGTYTADLVVVSDDPDEPEVALPVTLVAVGAPAVAVRPGAVAFGAAYVGTPLVRAVVVANPGSDTLRVSAVTVDDGRLAVDADAFDLLPGDSLAVGLTLTPDGSGPLSAALTLATNVGGDETVTVPVTATDQFPPVLAVAPGTVTAAGEAGEVASAALTVSNEGAGPLSYAVHAGLMAETVPARPRAVSSVRPTVDAAARVEASASGTAGARQGGRTGGAGDAPLVVLAEDADGNEPFDALALRGAVANDSLYLAVDFAERPDYIGFSVYLDLDTDPNTGHWLDDRIGAEAEISAYARYERSGGSVYGDVYAYEIGGHAGSYSGPSFRLGDGTFVIAIPLWAVPGLGRAFDLTATVYGEVYRDGVWTGGADLVPDGAVVSVQRAPWLAAGGWGELAPGTSTEVALALDASGLVGGRYEGLVVVEGNGLEVQRARVPVVFEVTGVPAAEAGPLAFGEVFVGHPSARTLDVTNRGTDVLTVTGAESDHAAVAFASREPLSLRPGASGAYVVAVTAAEAGAVDAALTLTTNDPDGPLVVAVTATAVPAPVAALSAAVVVVDVAAGGTAETALTLSNTGGSPLTYRARVASPTVTEAASGSAGGPAAGGAPFVLAEAGSALAAREAALARTGAVRPALASTAVDLPTLHVDPDEGGVNDLVELRGAVDADGDLALELVFARAVETSSFGGGLYLDTDRSAQTGTSVYLSGGERRLGTDVGIGLYGAVYGEVQVYQFVPPFASRYVPARVDGRTVRFAVPAAFVGDGSFDFVGETHGSDGSDVFPDEGVASTDARLGWLSLSSREGTVPAGGEVVLRLGVDASALALGAHRAVVQVSTNDPAAPVAEVPVTVRVTGGTAGEAAGPLAFGLAPPAPNPTRGRARLAYALAEPGPVVVEVFDAVGRRVAVLDGGARAAGPHDLDLDAAGLPAGLYSVRLRAGAEVAVQRLNVVR
jgi:hypothetical protein